MQGGFVVMGEHIGDLMRLYTPPRQLGQRVLGEEADLAGLDAGAGFSAGDLADEEHLVDRERRRRVALAALVPNGRELQGARGKARFLPDLALDAFAGALVDVAPAAGQGPAPVSRLSPHQDLAVAKGGAAHA